MQDDPTDGGGRISSGMNRGRATQDAQAEDAKAEGGSLCGINNRPSTKITKRAREKWISGGALE
jgi:hypothetical protein